MRLGAQKSELVAGTKTAEVYGSEEIIERHRHRYEMNNRYIPVLEEKGMKISGYSPVQHLVETVEIPATSLVYCSTIPPGIYQLAT